MLTLVTRWSYLTYPVPLLNQANQISRQSGSIKTLDPPFKYIVQFLDLYDLIIKI